MIFFFGPIQHLNLKIQSDLTGIVARSVIQTPPLQDFEFSIPDQKNPICQNTGFISAMGNMKYGNASILLNGLQQLAEFITGIIVQRTQGFVQTQDSGMKSQGAPQSHTLSFATAQSIGQTLQQMSDPNTFASRYALINRGFFHFRMRRENAR